MVLHFKSIAQGGFTVYAVSGTNTVSFGIMFENAAAKGLLGFAVERADPTESERYFMPGFKVFASVIPNPGPDTIVSTFDHPVQSFVWDDFTAKPGRTYDYWFYPLKGTAKNLDRSAQPVHITIATEALFDGQEHDVFFNRGVASSQAYARRFNNKAPDKQPTPKKQQEALEWLSRDLDDALLAFIKQAEAGDTLLGCFYEFRYKPVLEALRSATKDRGVAVKLILDSKDNSSTDKNGKFSEAFPREVNRLSVAEVGLQDSVALWRENNPDNIQHNKFLVLLRNGVASEVWTGSTNLSDGGIYGQTNVGHWLRNAGVASQYAEYWDLLLKDPGSTPDDNRSEATKKKAAFRKEVMDLREVPLSWQAIPVGTSTCFSPRKGSGVLDMYAAALDAAASCGCITLAFGVNKAFKSTLVDNNSENAVTFLLLEKRDEERANAREPFVALSAKNNVYQAWGSFLRDPLYKWARETNGFQLQLNTHVAYIHSKFLLKDPLSADPLVISGSANFSGDSTNSNDENMIFVRGNGRVADIYFTEFNRLFNHYYFRSVQEATATGKPSEGNASADATSSWILKETDEWVEKYQPGKLRFKRLQLYAAMNAPQIL